MDTSCIQWRPYDTAMSDNLAYKRDELNNEECKFLTRSVCMKYLVTAETRGSTEHNDVWWAKMYST